MAKIASAANDKAQDLQERIEPMLSNLVVSTQPIVICGVQRKANIGNFENTDIYCAVALPANLTEDERFDMDKLNEKLVSLVEYGFHFTSSETLSRYNKTSVIAKKS